MKKSYKTALSGMLLALSAGLSAAESLIPLPLGVKPGFSNIPVMFAMYEINTGCALAICILKSFFVFLTRGTTAFIMSISGGLAAFFTMLLLSKKTKVLFSALLVILDQSGISSFLKEVFSSFGLPDRIASSLVPVLLEVTTGSTAAAAAGAGAPFLSFALGWAGLCVDFQIFSMLRSVSFSKAVFLLFRLFHGLLSALFTVIGLHFFPITETVFFSTGQSLSGGLALRADGGLLLLLLCVVFLLSLQVKNVTMKKKKKSLERWPVKKKLFGNQISADCSYCEHGVKSRDGSYSCSQGRVLSFKGGCRAFRYDPLRRIPKTKPKLPSYSPEDFSL